MVVSDGSSSYRSVAQLRSVAETTLVRSGRINELINNALGYLEHCRQDLPKGLAEAAYINYWHAYLLLFDVIPHHADYEAFSSKKLSAFFQSYLELRKIIESEAYVQELETYLDERIDGSVFVYSKQKEKEEEKEKETVDEVKAEPNGKHIVKRKPMSTNGSSTSLADASSNGSTDITDSHSEVEDPLTSRFRKLRGPRRIPGAWREQTSHASVVPQKHSPHSALASPKRSPPSVAPPPPPGHTPRINPSIVFPKTTVINSETLAKYLQYVPESILVLDVRERRLFDQGHIAAPNIVCIEPVSLRQNMNDEALEETLVLAPENEQQIFANRSKFDLVVMYDADSRSNTYHGGPSHDSQAKVLFYITTAIYDYAFSSPLKRPPCLLVGGFETWLDDFGGKHIARSSTASSKIIQSPTLLQEIPSRPYGSRKGSTASIANGYARDLNDFFRSPPLPASAEVTQGTFPQSPAVYSQQQQQQQHRSNRYVNGYASAPSTVPQVNGSTRPKSLSISPPRPVYTPPNVQDKQLSMPMLPTVPGPLHSVPPPNQVKVAAQEFTTGLKNLGNTCYMNSILQCLAGTPILATAFVDGSYRRFVNVNSRLGYKGVLAQKFAELVQTMFRESVAYVGPVSLKELSGQLRETFRGYEQQDCQEFLTFILDGLHEDLNANGDKERLKELTEVEERRRETMSVRVASTIEWERYLKSDFSLIVDTCQGQYQSRLKCLTCNYTSTTYNVFSFLSLPIPRHHQMVTLHDCFDLFTAEEILDGDDAWLCPHCKQHRKTSKRLQISRLPNILIIHLKRFQQRGWTRTSDKLETFVTYPVNGLDLTRYWPDYTGDDEHRLSRIPVRGQTAPFKYDLYGVANHYGTLKGGHYTSFVKKGRKGWCYFDDIRVTKNVAPDSLVNQHAYVLFYERRTNFQ